MEVDMILGIFQIKWEFNICFVELSQYRSDKLIVSDIMDYLLMSFFKTH